MNRRMIFLGIAATFVTCLAHAAPMWSVVSIDADKGEVVVKDASSGMNRTMRVHSGEAARYRVGDPVPPADVDRTGGAS